MFEPPRLTEDVADRLERALAEASYWRGVELRRVADNPLRVSDRTFPHGPRARRVGADLAYYRYFSGPFELRPPHASRVGEMAAWYAQDSAPCFARLSPLFASEALLRALARAGLSQTGFMSLLYGRAAAVSASGSEVRVEQVRTQGQRQIFLDLWTRDAPGEQRGLRQQLASAEFAHWRCYVAFVDDEPAAHAALFVSGETRTGVLAAAATLERLRGRGCQSALIQRRIADAAQAGCDLVAVEATPGSQSQRNVERPGLRLA